MSKQLDVRCLHEAAKRMARQCRRVIQSVLREEEWGDADAEFYALILEELKQLNRMTEQSKCLPKCEER